MFSLATGIYQSYFAPPKLSILIIGLDGAGKTSLLERIKVTEVDTRIEVNGGVSPSLQASYAKGAVAVASLGQDNNAEVIGNGDSSANDPRRQPQRVGQHHDGGRPARLPPPLPPKQALKSRRSVEKMIEDGFSSAATGATEEEKGERLGGKILHRVPPPPLVTDNEDDGQGVDDKNPGLVDRKEIPPNHQQKKLASQSKPPLPPRHDNSNNPTTLTAVPETPNKRGSFIELFRCPSPAKYSHSALGEEEDEEFLENRGDASSKDSLETWSTEYLANYYINYQEGEEFDVKQPRGGGGSAKKMFPMDRIRPTLGQNLAKLDMCGCKCSLFDLSGAEKMRPLWERYYRDTDAIIYVVNSAEKSASNLQQSRLAFERMCQNEILKRRILCGLPILIFANQLDLAYEEYGASMEKANNENNGRGISWNADEEDDFVGGTRPLATNEEEITERAVDFHDLVELFGLSPSASLQNGSQVLPGKVTLFGGSAKSGEGVRAAMEYLVAHAKDYHLATKAQK